MRQKLKRFEANKHRDNILEPGKELFERIKGNWNSLYFKNDFPITIEVGCGRGEYTVGMANIHRERNYIGIDIKGDRIYKGSTEAIELNLNNVGFLRTSAHHLKDFFEEDEVDEVWLTFPDPRPRLRDAKRRLTHPRFMQIYQSILHQEGWLKFKTDNGPLFDFTLSEIEEGNISVSGLEYTWDLYASQLLQEHFGIQTRYEKIWSDQGEKIKYLKFRFSKSN